MRNKWATLYSQLSRSLFLDQSHRDRLIARLQDAGVILETAVLSREHLPRKMVQMLLRYPPCYLAFFSGEYSLGSGSKPFINFAGRILPYFNTKTGLEWPLRWIPIKMAVINNPLSTPEVGKRRFAGFAGSGG